MSTLYELVEGWTDPIVVNLLKAGAVPDGTMAGLTVELILKDQRGTVLATTGDVTVSDSATWEVTYSPDAGDLVEGTYRGRFAVTDQTQHTAYFPSAGWDIWHIRSVA